MLAENSSFKRSSFQGGRAVTVLTKCRSRGLMSIAVRLRRKYPFRMTISTPWPEIISYTRDALKDGFETLEAVGFSQHDAAVLAHIDRLKSLGKARPAKMRRQVVRQSDFELASIRRAFYAGLSLDGEEHHPEPYNNMLLMLSRQARKDQIAYDALGIHASSLIADGRPLVPELSRFVIDVLQGEFPRPKRLRGYKIEARYRDLVICWVIVEICGRFGLRPTRNAESKAGNFSACDAVADAMIALGRRPRSFVHIERIWSATDAH